MIDAAQHFQCCVGQGSGERLARTGKVLIADGHKGLTGCARQEFRREPLPGAAHDGGECNRVVARLVGVLGKHMRTNIGRVGGAFDGCGDALTRLVVGLEERAANASQYQLAKPSRLVACNAQQGDGAERETHSVDGFVGHRVEHSRGEVCICLGLVRFRCGAVPQQVDTNDRSAGVTQ